VIGYSEQCGLDAFNDGLNFNHNSTLRRGPKGDWGNLRNALQFSSFREEAVKFAHSPRPRAEKEQDPRLLERNGVFLSWCMPLSLLGLTA
jgi:hypothetical protein